MTFYIMRHNAIAHYLGGIRFCLIPDLLLFNVLSRDGFICIRRDFSAIDVGIKREERTYISN